MMLVKPPYRVSVEKDVPQKHVRPKRSDKDVVVRMVFGSDTSIMFATRESGYHTKPHWHDSEQFNYIVEGEIWLFVEEYGYRCVKGDLMRIPRNAIHWAWNRGNGPCTMIETHTPPLIGDEKLRNAATSMLAINEGDMPAGATNNHVDIERLQEIEDRAISEDAETSRAPS